MAVIVELKKGVLCHSFSDRSGAVFYQLLNGDVVAIDSVIQVLDDNKIECEALDDNMLRLINRKWVSLVDA